MKILSPLLLVVLAALVLGITANERQPMEDTQDSTAKSTDENKKPSSDDMAGKERPEVSVIKATIRLTEEEFTDDLLDPSSEKFKAMVDKCKAGVCDPLIANSGGKISRCSVAGFSQGSVKADIVTEIQEELTEDEAKAVVSDATAKAANDSNALPIDAKGSEIGEVTKRPSGKLSSVKISLRITNKEWNPAYADKTTAEFEELKAEVEGLQQAFQDAGAEKISSFVVTSFAQGSVKANATIEVVTGNDTDEQTQEKMTDRIAAVESTTLELDVEQSVVEEVEPVEGSEPVEATTEEENPDEDTTTEEENPDEDTTTEEENPDEDTTTDAENPDEDTTTDDQNPDDDTTTDAENPDEDTTTDAENPDEDTTTDAENPDEDTTTDAENPDEDTTTDAENPDGDTTTDAETPDEEGDTTDTNTDADEDTTNTNNEDTTNTNNEDNTDSNNEDTTNTNNEDTTNTDNEDTTNADNEDNTNPDNEDNTDSNNEDNTDSNNEDTTNTDNEDTTNADNEDNTNPDNDDTTNTNNEDTTNTNDGDSTNTNTGDSTNNNNDDTTNTNNDDTTNTNNEDNTNSNNDDTTNTNNEDNTNSNNNGDSNNEDGTATNNDNGEEAVAGIPIVTDDKKPVEVVVDETSVIGTALLFRAVKNGLSTTDITNYLKDNSSQLAKFTAATDKFKEFMAALSEKAKLKEDVIFLKLVSINNTAVLAEYMAIVQDDIDVASVASDFSGFNKNGAFDIDGIYLTIELVPVAADNRWFELALKLATEFDPALNDRTSDAYKKLKAEAEDAVKKALKSNGFNKLLSVVVTGFRPGSTVIDSIVQTTVDSNNNTKAELQNTLNNNDVVVGDTNAEGATVSSMPTISGVKVKKVPAESSLLGVNILYDPEDLTKDKTSLEEDNFKLKPKSNYFLTVTIPSFAAVLLLIILLLCCTTSDSCLCRICSNDPKNIP